MCEILEEMVQKYKRANRRLADVGQQMVELAREEQEARMDANNALSYLAEYMDPEDFNDEFGFYPEGMNR